MSSDPKVGGLDMDGGATFINPYQGLKPRRKQAVGMGRIKGATFINPYQGLKLWQRSRQ